MLRKEFLCSINSVFANFVCAEFLINGGDCSKDVRNGGWSVGRRGNRGAGRPQTPEQSDVSGVGFNDQRVSVASVVSTVVGSHLVRNVKQLPATTDSCRMISMNAEKLHHHQTKASSQLR